MVVLDTAALIDGKVKVLRKGVADGNHNSTISFRQYYSPDGKYVANATGDILYLVDAKTLEVIDTETLASPGTEQLHDAIFTPDSKYVVATSRTKRIINMDDCEDPNKPKKDEFLMDGHFKLYDVAAKKFIGKSASVCLACHDEELGTEDDAVHAVLCGLDGNGK
jgi:DNA-binding beta-propeller fold protein YncE